jgi:aspartate aminotransferase
MDLVARMDKLGTESAFAVLAKAKELEATGRRIVHMEIGEPDFATPAHIVESAVNALRAGYTHYVPSPGTPELRRAVSEYLDRAGRMRAAPDRVIIAPGAKPIMFWTILALCGPGDEVLYPDPGFPMYRSIAAFAGATPVAVPLREENSFRIHPDELGELITARTKLLVLNSPHNPCGSMLTHADCEAIAELCMRHDIAVLSDEVYSSTRYGDRHHSVLDVEGMEGRTVLLDGWSKTFAMTGWRLGFGVFPSEMVEPVTRLVVNSVSCTAAFSQVAAQAALEGPWQPVEDMVTEFRHRRDVIVAGLNDVPGITCTMPEGAFYAFPNVKSLSVPSAVLQRQLLEEAGVACLAGTSFGEWGEGYLRLSYACSVEDIRVALRAIADHVSRLPRVA